MVKYLSDSYMGYLMIIVFSFICFGYPLSASLSVIFKLDSNLFNILYRSIILIISLYIIAIQILLKKVRFDQFSIPLIVFLGVYLIRIMWDTLFINVQSEHSVFEIYSFYLGNIFIPVCATILASKYINLVKLIHYIFILLLISNILIITIFLDQRNWELAIDILVNRAEIKGANDSLLINPISYGLYGGYLVVLSSTLLVYFKKNISLFWKILLWFSILIGFVNLLISTSRGPFLFTSLALLFLFISNISIKRIKLKVLLKTLFVSLLFLFTLNLFSKYISDSDIEIGIFQRFINTKETLQSGEKEVRNELYQEGVEIFSNSPFLGGKFVLDSTQSYPHNVFIEILMSLGVVGIFIYALIMIMLIIKILHYVQNNIYLAPMCYLFVISFGISLTTGNLYQSVENWNILALLLVFPVVSERLTIQSSSN